MICCSSDGVLERPWDEVLRAIAPAASWRASENPEVSLGVTAAPTIGLPSMWAGMARPSRERIVGVASIRWAFK